MIISVQDLTVKYDGIPALEHVSFTVDQGDYLCILGENGSGKSTLLKCMLGIASASAGTIRFEGISRQDIGYLPQQTVVQRDFPASVWEVVLSGLLPDKRLGPLYGREERRMALRNMEKLGITELRNKSFQQLSGGQRQRVLLARSLASANSVLFMDEPTAALDPLITAEFYALVEKLNQKDGMTILMVTHDADNALRYGSKVLHLDRSVVFFGDVEKYHHSDICRLYHGEGCKC